MTGMHGVGEEIGQLRRVRGSEAHAALRASPEVQRLQRRQPLQRPRHSRPAVRLEAILTAADERGRQSEGGRSVRRIGAEGAHAERDWQWGDRDTEMKVGTMPGDDWQGAGDWRKK
jgi:hypothetical protein